MRTSVGSVAGWPFCGSIWMKSLAGERPLPDAFVEPSVEHDALAVGQPHGLDEPPRDAADQVLPLESQLLGRRPRPPGG